MSTGCAPPHSTNNLDGLGERLEVLSGTTVIAAHRGNRLPERAGAQAKLEAASADLIEAGRRFGEHRRRAQRQVRHRVKDAKPPGLSQDDRHERQRIEVAGMVRVILDANQVVAKLVDEPSGRQYTGGIAGIRYQKVTKLQVMSIIGHSFYSFCVIFPDKPVGMERT